MSHNEDNDAIRNVIAAAVLGLFGWHLLTLHNIAKSVDVLVNQVSISNQRIDRLENFVYFEERARTQK